MGASAMDVLMQHDWPGNIQELMHTIESLVVIGTNDVITPAELPSSLRCREVESVLGMISDMDSPDLNLKDATVLLEKAWLICEALKRHKTTTAASRSHGVDIFHAPKSAKYGI